MSGIGAEVVRMALHDITENQIKLSNAIERSNIDEEASELLKRQESLIISTKEFFDRVF